MKLLALTTWAVALSASFATVILPATALPSGGEAATMDAAARENDMQARESVFLGKSALIEAKTLTSDHENGAMEDYVQRSGLLDMGMGAHGISSTSRRSMALRAALTGNSGDPVLCKCCIDHNSNYCCGGGHCCNNACASLELEDRFLGRAAAGELPPVAAARTVDQNEGRAKHVERNTFRPDEASDVVGKRISSFLDGITDGHGLDSASRRNIPNNAMEVRSDPDLCACCNAHGSSFCCGTGLQTCCFAACDTLDKKDQAVDQAGWARQGGVKLV